MPLINWIQSAKPFLHHCAPKSDSGLRCVSCFLLLVIYFPPASAQTPPPIENRQVQIQLGRPAFSADKKKQAIGMYPLLTPISPRAPQMPPPDLESGEQYPAFIEVRDIATGYILSRLQADLEPWVAGPPNNLQFSPSAQYLAASWFVYEYVTGERGSVIVWDVDSERRLPLSSACSGPSENIRFLNNQQLAIQYTSQQGRFDKSTRMVLCQIPTGETLAHFPNLDTLYHLPQLHLLIGEGYTSHYANNLLKQNFFLQLWDSRSYKKVADFPQLTTVLSFEGDRIWAQVENRSQRALVDLKKRKIIRIEKL